MRAEILHAVGELLLAEGTSRLTFERIAKASGASRTTLYKWWPSIGALALDGYFHAVEETLAFPDTGDIRADLLTQLHAFAEVMTRTPGGRILTELIGASQTDAQLAASYRDLYSARRRRLAGERLRQARAQGQIRPDVDVQVMVDQLWGAIYHRLLIPDEPVTGAFVTALVDNLLLGVATRPGTGSAG
ncbi:TetR/AcrR family transcriptional regulator [Streptomyces sp. 2131.1]|uniref:TetR/AcrR family transcriptional regulator n=1 Tax=Streptomyces sp. 2131.1 TaxID=1855346 RepID=UPI00210AC10E|nr:TetR/AcrR family transcriptional regulator [Streptomyces sp. 2131.1]